MKRYQILEIVISTQNIEREHSGWELCMTFQCILVWTGYKFLTRKNFNKKLNKKLKSTN